MDNHEQRLDKAVIDAIRARDTREQGYRAQSLKIHPWVCGRCGREFNEKNLHHDNEHARLVDPQTADPHPEQRSSTATHKPFSDLAKLLNTDLDLDNAE